MTIHFDEERQEKQIESIRQREAEDLAQILSYRYGIDYADLAPISISTDALRVIKEEDAREGKLAAFALVNKKIKIAVLSPKNEKTLQVLKFVEEHGYTPVLFMVSEHSLEKAWALYKEISYASASKGGALDISNDQISDLVGRFHVLDDVKKALTDVLADKRSFRISHILEVSLAGAIAINVSDIHIEPEEDYIRLRFRLDGVLTEIARFDPATYNLLLSRIKLISGLKLNIKQEAQDGRFSVKLQDTDIEIRTSMLPGAYNESIVMRILNPNSIRVKLEDLGIPKKLLSVLNREIEKPNGMILTTGPTGSGKTTTLYAVLRKIHSPEVKIITIEDPIEYHLPGIVQTQTNDKGYNFSAGLRAAVRQDPDVIMVGEIRDNDTARIAIDSALTGHLVFSTLHTNNAAGAYTRLIDLGANPKVITSAVTLALAQRLLRKLCVECKIEMPLIGRNADIVRSVVEKIQDKSEIPQMEKMWVPKGCDKCNNTGYKGRIGVYEGILSNEIIEKLVAGNPSERQIAKAAEPQGILTMGQDGIIKVLNGITTLEELERIVDVEFE